MKNSDRLNQIAQYDLLCMMNNNMLLCENQCVIEGIIGKWYECPEIGLDIKGFDTFCDACVARWLNSEYDGRW